ncbi:MAG: TIGR03617 family F420-dependent LLM class oxidoreductase [Chloroflexi bacterium]|nr:TIGR03617 family F420-dependent LLM class oxidoreductase [Chloroflexota bacterium]
MQFDGIIPPTSLREIPEFTRHAESIGFDAIWSSETLHSPFMPLALVAEHSQRLDFGTAIAVAFARSPASLAYTAWDLAQASSGRFILGLGTQVKAHIERRFGLEWPASPVKKLRELIAGIRALWATWQTGERLNFRGEYFKLTLMSPFFNPGAIDHPHIPIYLAGVNAGLSRLAGEVADGFHAHPYHSEKYLREIIVPAIEQGAAQSGRARSDVSLVITAMFATNKVEEDFARAQIAFYASTPTYRSVMAHHGWEEVADQLSNLSRRGKWGEMTELINDEMLETFAVVAGEEDLAQALLERYTGLADRLMIYNPYHPGERDDFWKRLLKQAHDAR